MARYIDAEKLENDIIGQLVEKTHYHPVMRDSLILFIKILRNEPEADVVEVKHGCWKPIPHSTGRKGTPYECSICERTAGRKYEYCHCGAKMDGRSEQDER